AAGPVVEVTGRYRSRGRRAVGNLERAVIVEVETVPESRRQVLRGRIGLACERHAGRRPFRGGAAVAELGRGVGIPDRERRGRGGGLLALAVLHAHTYRERTRPVHDAEGLKLGPGKRGIGPSGVAEDGVAVDVPRQVGWIPPRDRGGKGERVPFP